MKQALQFYILACLLSWTIALPLALPYFGVGLESSFPYHHALVGLGPLLAAVLVKSKDEGKQGLRSLAKACLQTGNWWTVAVALLAPFLLVFISALFYQFQTETRQDLSLLFETEEFPAFSFTAYFFYNLFFFGFGEEVGWKGILLPAFQRQWSALKSSIFFTLFWAVWHLPLFFYRPGYVGMDVFGIIGWLVSLLTGSILLTWLFNSSRGSILICAIFHATIDMAFVNRLAEKNLVGYLGFLITTWGIAVFLFFGARNLSKQKRVTSLS